MCYLQATYFTFYAGDGNIEEALVASKSQEVRVCVAILRVFGICDWWRRIEDISFEDGGHHEMVGAY